MECPVCRNKRMNLLPWLGMIYECPECGWRSPIALEERKTKRLKPI